VHATTVTATISMNNQLDKYLMEAINDVDNVEEYNDGLLLRESFLADDVMLQVHQVGHFIGELVRNDTVKN